MTTDAPFFFVVMFLAWLAVSSFFTNYHLARIAKALEQMAASAPSRKD
jgi:hypothetical protein